MSSLNEVQELLARMSPVMKPGEFVFVSRPRAHYGDGQELDPIACFLELEGVTLIVPKVRADAANENYDGVFRMITLQVDSSLHAVGLTAAVSLALTKRCIPANIVAAFHHDHVFVPDDNACEAMKTLEDLASKAMADLHERHDRCNKPKNDAKK